MISSTLCDTFPDTGGYCSKKYQKALFAHGIICSMSRKGNCWDNSVAESFFGTLKTELIYLNRYSTRNEAKGDIFNWIEVFYNRQRKHSALGYLSPAKYQETRGVVA